LRKVTIKEDPFYATAGEAVNFIQKYIKVGLKKHSIFDEIPYL